MSWFCGIGSGFVPSIVSLVWFRLFNRPSGLFVVRTDMFSLTKIISGGQTGVDQAALRAAISRGIAIGGWCPPGRICEDGTIPGAFPLQETPQDRSPNAPDVPRSQRTEWNVRDSDATLILWPSLLSPLDPGTRWTIDCANHYQKPLAICDPNDQTKSPKIRSWLSVNERNIRALNVAGPSERISPGIGFIAERFMQILLSDAATSR